MEAQALNSPTRAISPGRSAPQILTLNPSAILHSNLFAKCHTFRLPTEITASNEDANITDCEYIGSYNWVSDIDDVSIIVPGSPREWRERSLPFTVQPDILGHYREQYDRRMRSAPLLPLLLSVNYWHEQTHPPPSKFSWNTVDFVTNRNSLRHLLRILRNDNCGGRAPGGHKGKDYRRGNFTNPYSQPFRIDVELVGNKTLLLNRWEPADTNSEPLYVNSFGFNFESSFTQDAEVVSALGNGESGRHYRINSYNFGGLRMVVRSEIDACLPASTPGEGIGGLNDDDLFNPPPHVALTSSSALTSFGMTIIPSANKPTPQHHLIELSTARSSTFKTWNAKERYPQLYFSQVPNHYLASHVEGTITQISKRCLHKSPEMLFFAPTIQPKLRMLRQLLKMIQTEVIKQAYRSRGTRKCFSLVYLHGQLSLFERVGARCLPEDAFAMFDI